MIQNGERERELGRESDQEEGALFPAFLACNVKFSISGVDSSYPVLRDRKCLVTLPAISVKKLDFQLQKWKELILLSSLTTTDVIHDEIDTPSVYSTALLCQSDSCWIQGLG